MKDYLLRQKILIAVALILSVQMVGQTDATSEVASQEITRNVYKPTIRIWLHGDSIRPSLIRTKPGVVVLRAENETRSNVSLVVEKVLLGRTVPVASIITTNGGRRARGEFVVEVGEYVYYDAARPQIKGSWIVEVPGQ